MAAEDSGPDDSPADYPRSYLIYAVLAFALSFGFAASFSLRFLLFVFIYGAGSANTTLQADSSYLLWVDRGITLAFFLAFYLIGRRIDFSRLYARLGAITFLGALIGALPQLVSVQWTPPSQSITGYALTTDPNALLYLTVGASQNFGILFAGLAVAFFLKRHPMLPTEQPHPEEQMRFVSPKIFLVVALVIAMLAKVASGAVDVIGSTYFTSDSFAFLRTFVIYSPYDNYVYYLFYPLLFFAAFYFLGRRLDDSRDGLKAFALYVFVAGTLSTLIGGPLEYYIRSLAASPSNPFPPFGFGLGFVEDSVFGGLYILAFGFAAASLGFLREHDPRRTHPTLASDG